MDNNSILPDFLCSVILIFALLLLRKFVKIPSITYGACGVYTVTSLLTYILSASFYSNYTLSLTKIRVEAYQAFQLLQVVKIADSIVFVLMLLSLFPILASIINQYTGYAPAAA